MSLCPLAVGAARPFALHLEGCAPCRRALTRARKMADLCETGALLALDLADHAAACGTCAAAFRVAPLLRWRERRLAAAAAAVGGGGR